MRPRETAAGAGRASTAPASGMGSDPGPAAVICRPTTATDHGAAGLTSPQAREKLTAPLAMASGSLLAAIAIETAPCFSTTPAMLSSSMTTE